MEQGEEAVPAVVAVVVVNDTALPDDMERTSASA